ncbi:hypothetical protein GCM10010232_40510 [Streptomyces amakusaensis]|uniref:Uncharacterized protein n=1 Tax=Streptomyces amakusaensis TaxID=67271 RepID=A0ABW0ALR7_9ACTN
MISNHLHLAAFPEPIPEAEAHIYWRMKDLPTPILDRALEHATHLYIGSWQDLHWQDGAEPGLCPALRVFSRMFYRGTIDDWKVPILNEPLRDELLAFYQPRPGDLPAEVADTEKLAAFLTAHLGWSLLCEEPPSAQAD